MSLALGLLAKSTLLLAATWLLSRASRRASAATRHGLWAIGLVALLLLTGVEVLAPKVELAVLPRPDPAFAEGPASQGQHDFETEDPPALPAGEEGASDRFRDGSEGVALSTSIPWDAEDLLLGLWLIGGFVVWGRSLVGARQVRKLARKAVPVGGDLRELLSELRVSMNVPVSRRIDVRVVDVVVSPMTWGLFRHVILLPSGVEAWAPDRQRIVMAHELAHVCRKDVWTLRVAQLVSGLYWMHPLVWHGMSCLRIEGERACDDQVINLGTTPSDYAAHLLALSRTIGVVVPGAALSMAAPSQLETRLVAILDPRVRRKAMSPAAGALLAFATATIAIAVGVGQLVAAGRPGIGEVQAESVEVSRALVPAEQPELLEAQPAVPEAVPPPPSPREESSPEEEANTPIPVEQAERDVRLVRANDVLRIYIFREPDLSGSVRVQEDGTVSMPLIQDLPAAGRSPGELANEIESRLGRFLEAPLVTVAVESAEPYVFYVTGNVESPGAYTFATRPTVLQVIAMAGGFRQFAARDAITIVRSGSAGDTVFQFDYDRAVSGNSAGQNIRLEPGDVVSVP